MADKTERALSLVDEMDEALLEVNRQRWWMLSMFLLASSPGVFNAYHILVSNFLAAVPPHWCRVPELEWEQWTRDQIIRVSVPEANLNSSCVLLGWNYTELVEMGYEKALIYVSSNPKPSEEPCQDFMFQEEVKYSSTVSEWNLVCDKKLYKSNVQGSIAIGKFVGGFLFGAISDRFGRKVGFVTSCLTYIVFWPLAAYAPGFWFFIVARFFIGIAGSGCYETGYTILAELMTKKWRASLGCVYNLSYPVGYITLPAIALLFPRWRDLQLAISLPTLCLLVNCWYLPESPRWLISQGRLAEAWSIVQGVLPTLQPREWSRSSQEVTEAWSRTDSFFSMIIGSSQKVFALFSAVELIKRISIAYFAWFVAALSYYVLALNAINFGANPHLYMLLSGLVEVPGYCMPLLLLRWLGRKSTTAVLFFLSGSALVSISFIPQELKSLLVAVAMLGRLTDVAVFSVVVVYTSELFPTTIRNTAIGSSLAISQFGSINAPYIVDIIGAYGWYFPSNICGLMALFCATLVLLLPETGGKPLLDTIEEIKSSPKEDKVSLRNCCRFS